MYETFLGTKNVARQYDAFLEDKKTDVNRNAPGGARTESDWPLTIGKSSCISRKM